MTTFSATAGAVNHTIDALVEMRVRPVAIGACANRSGDRCFSARSGLGWDVYDDYIAQSESVLAVQILSRLAITTSYVFQRDSTQPEEVAPDDHHVKLGVQLQL